MPTYQYSCNDCGHYFETVQSFSDDSLTVCPECEGRLRKVFNAVGVVFKGSGFYRTDSRSQKSGAETGAGGSDNGSADNGSKGSKSGSENASGTGSGNGGKSAETSSGGSSSSAPAPA